MIIIFGGTTEGLAAAAVLDEAGQPFFYSTRGAGQQVKMAGGIRLTGTMDSGAIISFCRKQGIRLIIDAAHPFADSLHANILSAARTIGIDVIRYERRYPPHEEDIVYCDDFSDAIDKMESDGVKGLLALTGVKTIAPLSRFWRRHETWLRILDREESLSAAKALLFPADHLLFYPDLYPVNADALLTKESGISGGFLEKTAFARRHGMRLYVVKKKEYTGYSAVVDGPLGLRLETESSVSDFFPHRTGITTGTCAAAAAVACLTGQRGEMGDDCNEHLTAVILPDGETIHVRTTYDGRRACCVKYAGDDPDVTDGMKIFAEVRRVDGGGITIDGGEGIGTVTIDGLGLPVGSKAINEGPRRMIRRNLLPLLKEGEGCHVVISAPGGAEIARKTFNARLGIQGGISIIGTSGIVRPFSQEAFVEAIKKSVQVAKAQYAGQPHSVVVLSSGAKSERFVRALWRELPPQTFVQYGNHIGAAVTMAAEEGIDDIRLCLMIGKAVKLAAGNLNTHSHKTVMDKRLIATMMEEAGLDARLIEKAKDITLARELWTLIPRDKTDSFASSVITRCRDSLDGLPRDSTLSIILIDDDGGIHR